MKIYSKAVYKNRDPFTIQNGYIWFFQKVVDISYSLKTWPELDLIASLTNFFINEQNNFVKSAAGKFEWRNLGILRLGEVFIYTFLFTTYM